MKINLDEYEQNIILEFNNKNYTISFNSLYLPIYLDENIIITQKTKNGLHLIRFSSPYFINNKLDYDIKVYINDCHMLIIEKGQKKFVPSIINYSLQTEIAVAKIDHHSYEKLNFKSAEPVRIADNNIQINSIPINFYSAYFMNFDSQEGICSIDFIPYITITNCLQHDLKLDILNMLQIELKPEKPVDVSFLKDWKKKVKFVFDFSLFEISNVTIEKNIKKFKDEIVLFNNDGKQIGQVVFECSEIVMRKKKYYQMKIYSPLILENHTSLPLSLQISKNLSYLFVNNLILYNSKQLMNQDCFIKLPIIYERLTQINSTNFENVGNFAQIIPLQHKQNDKINLLLLFEKQKSEFEYSSIITIRPYLKVHSDVNETLIFTAKHLDKNKIQTYDNQCTKGNNIILGSNRKGIFDIYVEGYQKCKDLNIFNLGSTVIRLDKISEAKSFLLIKIVVKKEENGYTCYLSYPTKSSDISIKNCLLNEKINVHQHCQPTIGNFIYQPMEICPNQQIIYAKEQPFLYEELSCKYMCFITIGDDSKKYLLTYEDSCHSKRLVDTNYCYDVEKVDRDNRIITIYQSLESNGKDQKSKKDKKTKKIFSINLSEIQASFIDKKMNELFLITLKKIKLHAEDKINFSIEGFSLNDMYSASSSPVVLNGMNTPFLSIEIFSKYALKKLMFECINIQLTPIQAFIDFHFIGDLIAAIKGITNIIDIKLDILLNIFSTKKFTIKDIVLYVTPRSLFSRQYRFEHADHFHLSYFKILISKEMTFDFKEINKYNIEAPIIDFFKTIPDSYIKQFTFSKGLLTLAKSIIAVPNESKTFIDFLKNKQIACNESILEYLRRIPRVFPNGKILDIPKSLTDDDYPDFPTMTQFVLQTFYGTTHSNEQLKEIFIDDEEKSSLAIFDNLIFIYHKNDAKPNKINFADINSIVKDNARLKIKHGIYTDYFTCDTEENAYSIYYKVRFIIQKTKILKQFL